MPVSPEKFENTRLAIDSSRFERQNYFTSKGPFAHLRYRVFRPFLKLKYKRFRQKHPDAPWLNPDAIKALDQLLTREMVGFEYGSGFSTVFFASRINKLTSLEHNKTWFDRLDRMLTQYELSNAELVLIEANEPFDLSGLNSLDQLRMTPDEYPVPDCNFSRYTDYVRQLPDQSLHLLIVDGRARVTCAVNGISKLKSGGLLVLDNSERYRYRKVHELTRDWLKLWTTSGLTDTTIWLKP